MIDQDPTGAAPTPADATVGIVTVTYSSGEHLRAFLASLGEATVRPVQVVLADNGSTDDSLEVARRDHPDVTILHTGANIGYGAAANRGVAEIDPSMEFVVVANPDVEWKPGSIDELIAVARRHPRAGSVGPLIREPDGSVYPSARSVPDLVSGTGHALAGKVWKNNPWTARYRHLDADIAERAVGWLSGSCLLLRRTAFDSVNGFDSRYFMYMEDVDLGDRLGRAGWLNVYAPSAEIIHRKGHVAGADPEAMLPAHHRSAYRFQADRHPGPAWAPLRGALAAGLFLRSKVTVSAARRGAAGGARRGSAAGGRHGVAASDERPLA
ncbi:glycosyltransferase family 2 protein [Williamsia deligens]|uniref:Glycosyltransferase family 2 protein n=1 Tax=Williamsia deligens TaxID=321325 RepID=A0ABW3G9N6_9NOCA|nr:glycosyltransferase family 2 protein [Williamsia deligens]MCP2196210.1 N-acetylglucosaminyl-diphospho-decaprenol L-rhamnosyltransferase [Williamsia deligens]